MTTTTDLSVAARRRSLCGFADDYAVELRRSDNDRPITIALPVLLPLLCAAHLPVDTQVALFDEFARARAVTGRADVSYDHMDEAEARAEMLLGQLVGEWFG